MHADLTVSKLSVSAQTKLVVLWSTVTIAKEHCERRYTASNHHEVLGIVISAVTI